MKVCREKELNLCCFFLWRFKRVPVFMAGTFVIFAGFQIARLMQGCGKVNARLRQGSCKVGVIEYLVEQEV